MRRNLIPQKLAGTRSICHILLDVVKIQYRVNNRPRHSTQCCLPKPTQKSLCLAPMTRLRTGRHRNQLHGKDDGWLRCPPASRPGQRRDAGARLSDCHGPCYVSKAGSSVSTNSHVEQDSSTQDSTVDANSWLRPCFVSPASAHALLTQRRICLLAQAKCRALECTAPSASRRRQID